MKSIKNFIKGMLVGIANVIPGVSGGTIAVVLGIFDELIESVNNIFKDFKKYILFLLPIGLGAGAGILAFSKLLEYCLENYSFPTNLFFVGLVAGSLPLIYGKAISRKFKKSYLIPFFIAIAVVVYMAYIKEPGEALAYTVLTPTLFWQMLFGGLIAAAAMVMPGISGSFVMVLLGLYPTVIKAVSNLNVPILFPLAIGVALGILLISKIIAFLLEKAFSATYFAILGLVASSIYGILVDPNIYKSGVNTTSIIISIVTFSVGFLLAYNLGKEK